MIKIGIIGTGQSVAIAHYHELGIRHDGRAKIAAVFDINKELAEKWVIERNLDAIVCDSVDEMFDLVDAVDICTPNFCHYEYIMKAIEHHKDFFVEKPPAITAEEINKIIEKCPDDLVSYVGFIYRHIDLINNTKKYIKERIGNIYTYTTYYGGKRLANELVPMEWRFLKKMSGSGAIGDFLSHVIDVANYVCGIELCEVSSSKNTFIKTRPQDKNGNTQVENDDAAVVSGIGKNGELFSATVSRVGMDEMTIIITGEGGMIQASIRNSDEILFWERLKGQPMAKEPEIIKVPHQEFFTGWFEKEMADFISALERKNKEYPNIKQSLYIMDVLEKIDQAADKKVVIKI